MTQISPDRLQGTSQGTDPIQQKRGGSVHGHTVQYIESRPFSTLERLRRICLGILSVICTVGLSLLSKKVRQLFDAKETKIFIETVVTPHVPSSGNIAKSEAVKTGGTSPIVKQSSTSTPEVVKESKTSGSSTSSSLRGRDLLSLKPEITGTEIQQLLDEYGSSMKKEGRIFLRDEFEKSFTAGKSKATGGSGAIRKSDNKEFCLKVSGTNRVIGADFARDIIEAHQLKHIKIPEKILVQRELRYIFQESKTDLNFKISRGQAILNDNPYLIYSETVTRSPNPQLSLEQVLEWATFIEKSGYQDFDGINFLISDDGIFCIDTEVKEFDPSKPRFDQIEALKQHLSDDKDKEAFAKEIDARKKNWREPAPRTVPRNIEGSDYTVKIEF